MIHHYNCLAFIILMLFKVPFYHFLFSRYLHFTKCHFWSDILFPFPDSSNLYSHVQYAKIEKAFLLRERKANILTLFSIYQITKFQYYIAKVNYLHWTIPEKKREGTEDILFAPSPHPPPPPPTPWNFSFFYFTPGNSRLNKAPPLKIPQIFVRFLGNTKANNQDPRKFHIIFSWSPFEILLRF